MVNDNNVWLISQQEPDPHLLVPYTRVQTINKLPKADCKAIIFTLQTTDDLSLLYKLRQNPEFRFTPVFYHGDLKSEELPLFDGLVDEFLSQKSQTILERLALIPEELKRSDSLDLIILIYLFSRQTYSITGFLDNQNFYVLSYPLINLYINNESYDSWLFLQNYVQRNLLTEKKLIDEIQACPFCHCGSLNFKNSCPNCQSIDIKAQQFIHCFSCGNIAPMDDFMTKSQLICSRCNAKLRHIGIDYDKPLEDKSCNQCRHYFIEAETMVICLSCKKLLNPEELQSRRLYEYDLSQKGELYARGVEKKFDHNFSYLFDLIDYESLIALIEWQKKLIERYPDIYFCLVGLKIKNTEKLVQLHGLLNTEKIILELFGQIRQLLRKTDLVSKVNECIIFFLPMTNLEGGKILINKIYNFILKQRTGSQHIPIEVVTSLIGAEELVSEAISTEFLLTELTARLENKKC